MKQNESEACGEFVVLRPETSTLDVGTAAAFKERLVAAAKVPEQTILVDLSRVREVDSSGLGALVAGLKAARGSGGTVRLFGAPKEVRDVILLTMLDRVLPLFETIEEAMRRGTCKSAGAGALAGSKSTE